MIDALISCDGREGLAPFVLLATLVLLSWADDLVRWALASKKDPNAP